MLSPVALPVVLERLGVVLGPSVDDIVGAGKGDGHTARSYLAHQPAGDGVEQEESNRKTQWVDKQCILPSGFRVQYNDC